MNNIFVALDNMSRNNALEFLKKLKDNNLFPHIKIGLELFLKYHYTIIHDVLSLNFKIFLDLKLHDIPNTVKNSIRSLSNLPIDFLTLHLSGGENMLKEAIEARNLYLPNTRIIGVSFLTSLEHNDLKKIFNLELNEEAFLRLFDLAKMTNLDGVVCSGHEINIVKKLSPKLLCIVPGIRFESDDLPENFFDQKRVMTPQAALNLGADYLVIGRPITRAKDPVVALNNLKNLTR